ncbi:MAG: hypothetical protein HPY85_10665 [Anaerolineae bacterium]|nr:hypothetical protein [Anaerolineae bacterium]
MGIKFAKDPLLAALKTAAAFAGKFMVEKEGLPLEQMTLMRLMFNGASLIIEATNLEMGIHMEIPAPGSSETRSYQLPAKTLLDAVSASGDEIELVHEKAGLGVKTQTGKSTIKNVGGELIPLIDCGAAATTTTHFTCAEMAKAINMVAFAAAKEDEARPYLSGVRIMPEHGGSVSFVAADGVRMAVYTTRTTTPEAFSTAFTLPIASVPAIANCLAIQHGNVALTVISNRAIFHWNWDENENNFNGYVFALRQADNFPDWHALVPRTCKTKLTFDGALAAALKTARVIARESDELPKVTLKINDLKAVVESEVAEVGATSTEVTPISVEGMNGVEVSFNVNLVPLAQIGASGTVIVGLNPPQEGAPGPIIWKLPSVEGWQYLLMPLRSF